MLPRGLEECVPLMPCTLRSVPYLALNMRLLICVFLCLSMFVYACWWQAEAARDLLEIQAERVTVEQGEVGYIIGKGGETIRELQVDEISRPHLLYTGLFSRPL